MSRPKKSNPRNVSLEFRVEAAEKQAFQDAANFAGISLAAWARERLRRAAVRELEHAAIPIAFLQDERE